MRGGNNDPPMDINEPGTDARGQDKKPPIASEAATAPEAVKQQAFFSSPELMAIALETAQIGIWSCEIPSNRITWSSNLERIHQRPPGSLNEAFSFFENEMHPEDRADVLTAIQETLRTHEPHRALYRLPPHPDRDDRWIEIVGSVVLEDGVPMRIVGTCRDVTERVKLHHELRLRVTQQEVLARLGERALIETDLQKFFDEAVGAIADILKVELVKILELVPGDAELILRAAKGFEPSLVGAAYVATGRDTQAGFTLASGQPVVVENLPAETRFTGAPFLHEHGAISGVSTPIAGRDGRAYGVLSAHSTSRRKFSEHDVSFMAAMANVIAGAIQRMQLDRRHELMIRELRHRSGNLFSQLLALFSQTARNSKDVPDLVTKYEARVLAIANAHRLVSEGGWKAASLTELLNTLLAPYLDRISFSGPNVFLEPDATFGISMAVHELASNASSHGSLSRRPGVVTVTWNVDRTERGLTLVFDWEERLGPTPKKTRRAGFGSQLINMVIERQLNGQVQQTFGEKGFDAKLIVPLTHERWPGSVTRSGAADAVPQ
jgi:PAS domain S-box-containing protein